MQLVDHAVELPELTQEYIFEGVDADLKAGEEWACTPVMSLRRRPKPANRHLKRGKCAFIIQKDDTPPAKLEGIVKVCISAIKAEPSNETEALVRDVLMRVRARTGQLVTIFREAGMLGYYIHYLD